MALSAGQTHEMQLAYTLLEEVADAYVVGDRAYDARALTAELRARGCTVVIPTTRTRAIQRDFDRHLYRERALVESFFQRVKRLRRVAMRYDKLARNFMSFLQLAAVLLWLL